MRILTVLAGIVVSACGAFCFAVYTELFTSVAFIVGMAMVLSGCANIAVYLMSGIGKKGTTETPLVEGLVTLLYGFAVLNNQVTDLMLTMFFGTWLTLCGVTRLSQAFYVSRFRPKDWAKIMPFAAISIMLGVVMMMPKLVSAVTPLMLVGGAFILVGLSTLMYSIYMKKPTAKTTEREAQAIERAAAKKTLALEKRAERDRLRKLSKDEREAEQEKKRLEKEALSQAKQKAREEERAARREVARPASEKTMQFTPEEMRQIKNADSSSVKKETDADNNSAEKAFVQAAEKPAEKREIELLNIPVFDFLEEKSEASEPERPQESERAENSEEEKTELLRKDYTISEEPAVKPIWQRPTDIPSVRVSLTDEKAVKDTFSPLKFTAVNLEEIESKKPQVIFDKVELPEFKLMSDDNTASRDEVLEEIKNTSFKGLDADYTPISLDELVAEPLARPYDPKEATRFTQTLNFGWLEEKND